jgi:hypothetical protein
MLRTVLASLAAAACAACVTTGGEATQAVRVETRDAAGNPVAGAECRLTNDRGSVSVRSGETALVGRSSGDLDIRCTHPENREAVGRAVSRASAVRAGAAVMGLSTGALYSYPSWVQLTFGKVLIFDRAWEQEGQPVPGAEPGAYR